MNSDLQLKFIADTQEDLKGHRTALTGLEAQRTDTAEQVVDCGQLKIRLTAALEIAQHVAQNIQEQAHEKIAGVVTNCLQMVFEKPYVFKIIFTRKRGRTEADLVFEKDGITCDPLTASGGGVVDVAAFALRLSCIVLNKPTLRRVVLLDEPFKFVSAQYRDNVRQMLEDLAQDFQMQFIMVTHIDELISGKVHRI